ncbi:ABC transporter ATP-binding protein [Falsihalocynthiibacter arcticus]|uniref:Glycerol-3-phosphate ABC transporter ATP-binding protein n=1 Tax=Falsihalocynthiibacter arcticus TaxID=1579316 RepID=A0A126V0F5_9RHOB|nr:ABC transporter ATP-binding protein [Falsihalocynthiibacter arcticus]AML51818.1 glycerol-3-phosphate ABC transporter ATP-binding protein [Falsihalocynthiibacter arcticus]
MAEVSIKGLRKAFGDVQILQGIDLTISDGEFVSLVGPSGCGKSTLLRIIAGLEKESEGSICIGNEPVTGIRASDRNLSMVFQSYALYPHLSVAENIAVPLQMRNLNTWQRLPLAGRFMPEAKARIQEIATAVLEAAQTLEIEALLDRKPSELSGGQRQRVALGRALVRQPAAFLLDEPLSNLDAKLRVHTRTEIAELHRKLGATFIYVTHDQVEAMTMSDRIAVMMGGEILQCAPPQIVYADPDDLRVAEFIGSPKINVLPVEADHNGKLSLMGRVLPLTTTKRRGPLQMGLRPEMLRMTGADSMLTGRVVHLEHLGSELFAQIIIEDLGTRIIMKAEPEKYDVLQPNQVVGMSFDPNAALFFDADGKRERHIFPAMHLVEAV